MTVAFNDIRRQTREVEGAVRRAIDDTLAESRFIGGAAVAEFERAWAAYCGTRYAVGCGSGAHAIAVALRARGIGTGDEVVVPANTCVPTVAGIRGSGATPVLADVDPRTLTLDPASAEQAITERTRAIVPVHLYGLCADMDALGPIAREHGLFVLEDAAHAHGATLHGRKAGSLGDAAAFSFYPTKNLGALGDAGIVTTDDAMLDQRLRELRNFGRSGRAYLHQITQTRLATIQAAVLLAKLPSLDGWNARRREHAEHYREALAGSPLRLPEDDPERVYHLFVVRADDRDELRSRLEARGVSTALHYSPAIHGHPAFAELPRTPSLEESERAAASVFSLPLYPQLTDAEVDEVIACFAAG